MAKPDLTAQRLRELPSYDPDTGLFTRLVASGNRAGIGTIAGCYMAKGYVKLSVESREFLAHRLAWLYVHGVWPTGQVDHINGIRDDNRIVNLRDVDGHLNQQNRRKARRDSATGLLGVAPHGRGFSAVIRHYRRKIYLGTFDTAELAHEAYLEAKRALHASCSI